MVLEKGDDGYSYMPLSQRKVQKMWNYCIARINSEISYLKGKGEAKISAARTAFALNKQEENSTEPMEGHRLYPHG